MMTIDKVTAIRNFLSYYSDTTVKAKDSAESFQDLLKAVSGDTVSLTQKKTTTIEDDNLRFVAERLKYSTLSGSKKESLLKQVWTMARSGIASGESESAHIDDKTAGEVLKMVSVMEFLDQSQRAFNDYLSDSANLNKTIGRLLDEDEKYAALNQQIQTLQSQSSGQSGTETAVPLVSDESETSVDITI